LGYVYQATVDVPESCKVELVGMNDLFVSPLLYIQGTEISFKLATAKRFLSKPNAFFGLCRSS